MIDEGLWGDEFVLPEKEKKEKVKKVIEKATKPKDVKVETVKAIKKAALTLDERLKLITDEVYRVLGKQVENTVCLRSKEALHDYISKCIENGRIAIDTETNNSLDPVTCKIMGLCLYTPGEKQAYIPVNHRNKDTKELLANQVNEGEIKEELDRLIEAKTFVVLHNAKFDYEVLKCTCGFICPINWDTMIGAKLLDENRFDRGAAGLKSMYTQLIDSEQEKYDIEHLFKDVEYADVDPEVFALYAATDSMMTDKIYLWEKERFDLDENKDLLNLANTIEMPALTALAEMEMAGMEVDLDYGQLLSNKYHKILENIDLKIADELKVLQPKVDAWKLTPEANAKTKGRNGSEGKSKVEQLEDPINLGSPTQLAILFYDILKAPVVDQSKPRGTGEEALQAIAEKLDLHICKLILDRREIVKLLSTYIDTIPELAQRWPDHRVRTHFNSYGAATGRLSSSEPINFQNIPSHNKEIRMLFKAKDGYRIVGGDFSAQEPRLTAFMSQDPAMIKAYSEGKDLYSVIAAMSFDRKYEDCLEFYPEGTEIIYEGQKVTCGYKTHQNKEGKNYRSMAKSILLGIEYGRGAKSVGEQIGKSRDEAQKIIDQFFKSFPKVKEFIDSSIDDAHTKGFVTDVAGRHRRLPDAQLPRYDIKMKDNASGTANFNPLLGCSDRVDTKLIDKYNRLLAKDFISRKEYESIQQRGLIEGVEIHDNTGFIAQAERQAVNSRIQGGAASLTKWALISIYNDKRLRDIGAYLINTVHDEILLEVPEQYSELAEKLLVDNMVNSAKDWVHNVPMKCDTYNTPCWYLDEFFVTVESEFKKLLDKGMSPEVAYEEVAKVRTESTRTQLYEIVKGYMGSYIPEGVDTTYKSL